MGNLSSFPAEQPKKELNGVGKQQLLAKTGVDEADKYPCTRYNSGRNKVPNVNARGICPIGPSSIDPAKAAPPAQMVLDSYTLGQVLRTNIIEVLSMLNLQTSVLIK